jgi:hypothetical protein
MNLLYNLLKIMQQMQYELAESLQQLEEIVSYMERSSQQQDKVLSNTLQQEKASITDGQPSTEPISVCHDIRRGRLAQQREGIVSQTP